MEKDKCSNPNNQAVVTELEGDKPPVEIIYEGPTQPEEREQFNNKLEETEEEADELGDEIKPEVNSGFFAFKSKFFMKQALIEAKKAYNLGEIPIGAVLVKNNKIIARDHNRRETQNDLCSHAEINVLTKASKLLDDWRLTDCELYVTVEPCPMCFGAILQSNIKRIVFGANEKNFGAIESKVKLNSYFNKKIDIHGGILEKESTELLSNFFKNVRKVDS